MATFALSDAYVAINGTDRSSVISAVTLQIDAAELDATAFSGSSGWTVPIAGRKSGSLQLTFNQDMAASAIDSIMWPLFGTTVTFEIRGTSASVGTSNPKYTGSMLCNSWSPVNGSAGDLATVSVTFPLSGAVTRATA